jgi:hypothetical protein
MNNPYKKYDLKKFLESISPEEIERKNRIQEEENERVYFQFIAAQKLNKCFLCGLPLNEFDKTKFCYHWFLYPFGIKKRDFDNFLHRIVLRYFNLDSYFRWLANYEKPFRNINDLSGDIQSNQVFQYTIKYKSIEWSISASHSDVEGHNDSQFGREPHFHLQMKVNDLIFIKFNDYHLRFSDEDLFNLELIHQNEGRIGIGYHKGQGISVIEAQDNLKILDDKMTLVDDESTATFRTQTFIQAPDGKPIEGELVQKLLEESNKTKIPFRRLLKKYRTDCKITTIISAGDGVPKMKNRKRRGKSGRA